MTIWHTLWPFALIYDNLVYFVVVCYTIPILAFSTYQDKSGNPGLNVSLIHKERRPESTNGSIG
jgi:hypothetical protein